MMKITKRGASRSHRWTKMEISVLMAKKSPRRAMLKAVMMKIKLFKSAVFLKVMSLKS